VTIALPNCEKITKVETYKLDKLEITANFLLGNEFSPVIPIQPNFCRKNRKYFQVSRISLKLRKNLTI